MFCWRRGFWKGLRQEGIGKERPLPTMEKSCCCSRPTPRAFYLSKTLECSRDVAFKVHVEAFCLAAFHFVSKMSLGGFGPNSLPIYNG